MFAAMLVTFYLLNNTFSLSVIDLSLSLSAFTVKSNSSGMLFSATAREEKKVDLNVLWSLVREKTVVLPHINTDCRKLTYTLKLSELSFDTREVVAFLWLPKMSLPDLRDDVIGFFKCLRKQERKKDRKKKRKKERQAG